MYSNIGSKIKMLAKIVCGIGILFTIMLAISTWSAGVHAFEGTLYPALATIIILVVGGLFSWIGTWVLYAIGQAS